MPGLRDAVPGGWPVLRVADRSGRFEVPGRSGKRIISHTKIAEESARLDRKIADYLSGLDEADERPDAMPAAMAALQARHGEFALLAVKLDDTGRATLVEQEQDVRPIGKGNGPKPPSYNVQTAVDAQSGLIIYREVKDEVTDNRLLYPMALATKPVLGKKT